MRHFVLFMFSVTVGSFLVMAGGGHYVRAQSSEPSASQLADRAQRAYDVGQWEGAIEGFARAYQISGESDFLFRLADSHRAAGHDVDASRTFQTYLRRDPQGSHRELAQKHIKDLDEKIRQAKEGRPATGAVGVVPSTSSVVTGSPAPLRAASPSPPPSSSPSSSPSSPAAVKAIPPALASDSEPNRRATAASSLPAHSESTSARTVGADLNRTATVTTKATEAHEEASSAPLPRWLPWVAAAATVGLGIGATVVGLSASRQFDDLQSSCGATPQGCSPEEVNRVKSRARTANILWAATGAAALATGITIFVNVNAVGASGIWAF